MMQGFSNKYLDLQEPKLTSNTKPDTTACHGAWYTRDRILQTSLEALHPVIDTPKVKPALLFMLRNEDFLDVDCNNAEVMILSFNSCESLLFSNLFQRDCPSVLLEDKQKELHRRVKCLAIDGDFYTVRLSPYFDTKYILELAFQCNRFEVNQHPVADVMPILLKSGQSASREEVVEEMNDCRSMKQHWCRSTVMP
ncbi:hypothetical protein DY000_02032673 [Brassica cretica]|uniref:Uncharacterized protein n=1 Tax=Brassica cretica TaxID=69181 RepID=A0ABQ7DG80_BRACR|nr:hypothetical protein DY000_02032673 [Brassica cretica]